MSDAAWVMSAGAAAWLGIGLYLLYLARKSAALEARLARLERLEREMQSSAAPGADEKIDAETGHNG